MNIHQLTLKQSILAAARQATKAEARRRVAVRQATKAEARRRVAVRLATKAEARRRVAVRLADQAADRAAKLRRESANADLQVMIRDSRAQSATAEVEAATARINSLLEAMDASGIDREKFYEDPDVNGALSTLPTQIYIKH